MRYGCMNNGMQGGRLIDPDDPLTHQLWHFAVMRSDQITAAHIDRLLAELSCGWIEIVQHQGMQLKNDFNGDGGAALGELS